VLTRFLKDSLVGNVKTAMIATISTHRSHLTETVSSCRFAESVATVTTLSFVNQTELPPSEVISRLREEVTRLREELSQTVPRSLKPKMVTEFEAVELQRKLVSFVEDETDQLDVDSPAEVQFCFQFMKDLIRRGNNSALRVSQLQQRLDESERNVQNLVRLMKKADSKGEIMSKEAAYLEFCNSHEKCGVAQGLKESLKEKCGIAKKLNYSATLLRRQRDDVHQRLEKVEGEIDLIQEKIESGQIERGRAALELAELGEEQSSLEGELERFEVECNRNLEDLNLCKEEIIGLQRELNNTRSLMQEEFEKFWMSTMMKRGWGSRTGVGGKRSPIGQMRTAVHSLEKE
jgi:kinesin family protein 6/9